MVWRLEAEKIGIKLPPGFFLEEDEDFLYLMFWDGVLKKKGDFYDLKIKTKRIGVFNSRSVNPAEIETEAERYFKRTLGEV